MVVEFVYIGCTLQHIFIKNPGSHSEVHDHFVAAAVGEHFQRLTISGDIS